MPFIDTLGDDGTTFYNVVRAVGQNCPNQYNDVKLVQMLLQMYYRSFGQAPKGQMVVDGICGPVTKNWILKWQLDMSAGGGHILADKRIDRARDHQAWSTKANAWYSILALGDMVRNMNPGGWEAIPGIVPMVDAESVPAPGYDYVSDGPAGQSTSVGRTRGGLSSSSSWAA